MGSKKRVLVVDDEQGVLRLVESGLGLAGYEVQATTDPQEALAMARAHPPDVVLIDIVMGSMSGFQVLEKLRGFSDVPAIVFTAKSSVAQLALEAGASDFIAKPFRPEDLEKKIAKVLAEGKTVPTKP
jgi:CheY-like chemotaxis protein